MAACGRDGCAKPGIWYPVLVLRAHGGEAGVVLALKVCERHRKALGVEDFVTEQGWREICAGAARIGRPEPDRALTTLEWTLDPGFAFPAPPS